MARLTNKDYLLRRKFLQRLWDFDETQKFYALVTFLGLKTLDFTGFIKAVTKMTKK